jgi:hypothetical protein
MFATTNFNLSKVGQDSEFTQYFEKVVHLHSKDRRKCFIKDLGLGCFNMLW